MTCGYNPSGNEKKWFRYIDYIEDDDLPYISKELYDKLLEEVL